jgi:hypothetical protein
MPTKTGTDPQKDKDQPTRTRVSRACDRCRSKKDKCDGTRPTCSSCANSGHKCTYDPSTKKRGLPEGYVRGLEKLWAVAIRKIEGFEDVMTSIITDVIGSSGQSHRWLDSPQSLRTNVQNREFSKGGDDVLKRWNDERVEEYLHETWKESPVSRELEKLLSSIESSDDKNTKRKRERDDLDDAQLRAALSTSGNNQWEFSIIKKQGAGYEHGHTKAPIWNQSLSETHTLAMSPDSSHFSGAPPPKKRIRGSRTSANLRDSQTTARHLSLPANTSQLIDLYFTHTHCWLPIIERHDILRVSYLYSENPTWPVPSEKGSGVHAALWAILAYSHVQIMSGKEQSNQEGPSGQKATSEALYDVARSLVPLEDSLAEIGHVQALILLALINVGQGKWTSAWLLIGHAVRLAMDLDLGRTSSLSNGQGRNREKHVFFGCFMIDTLISARLERCPHLRREDAELAGMIDEDGLEEWDLWADTSNSSSTSAQVPARRSPTFALSTFNRTIELFGLLNDIIRDLSTDREGFCGQITQRLQAWHDKLPQVYKVEGDPSSQVINTAMLPHQLYLYLGYFTTLTSLHFHSYPYRKAFDGPERRAPEIFAYLPSKINALFKKQAEAGRLAYVPPIYVLSTSLSIESAQIGRSNFGAKNQSFTEWMQQTFKCVSELGKTWPVYTPLRQNLANEWQMGNESFLLSLGDPNPASGLPTTSFNVPTDVPLGQSEIWIPSGLPEPHAFEARIGSTSAPSRDSRTSITDSVRTPRANSGPVLPPFSTPPESRNDGSPVDQIARNTYNPDLWPIPQTSNMLSNPQLPPQPPEDYGDVDMSGLDHVPTNVTDITIDDINFMTDDVDAIFRDLAHLDTTEWTNNREQGLRDFGFADDSTFRAFCNDPERLVTGNAFFQTSPSAEMWPPGLGDERGGDRHLEASQILQSLSGEGYAVLGGERMGW